MSKKRELGFYWVKIEHHWEIAQLFMIGKGGVERWFITGDEYDFGTDHFSEIGPLVTPPTS